MRNIFIALPLVLCMAANSTALSSTDVDINTQLNKAAIMASPVSELDLALSQQKKPGPQKQGPKKKTKDFKKGNYEVRGRDVFFKGRPVKDAVADRFEVLNGDYARDTHTVYYCGKPVQGAAAGAFRVLGQGYAKDRRTVFYKGKLVKGAAAASFRVLTNGNAKDDHYMYRDGKRVMEHKKPQPKPKPNGHK